MGNRYRVTIKFYSDAERTNLIKSVNTSFGIAVAASTFTHSFTVWEPSVGVFDAYLAGGETSSLGVPYQDRVPPFLGIPPNSFIPISEGIVINDNAYYSIIFNNGARIESSVGVGGRLEIAYDKDGNQVHAGSTSQQACFTSQFNGWYREFAIVAKSITNHVISSELGVLGIQGAYSGSWKQQAFGTPPTASWLSDFLNNYVPYTSSDENPYEPGGITTTGGGQGGFEIVNDNIDFPSTPLASAANANFISIWTPTLDQVQTLAKWLWTTNPLQGAFWQKLIQNPLELIFNLSILPIPIFHTDDTGTATEDELVALNSVLTLGWQDTGIRMDWVTEQYITLDMGSIELDEYWGAFLDYEPYTKISIYLPYIGVKQLDTNDCMPRNISLRYVIDLATGTCVAMIKCDDSVYYHFSGNCASQIPITVNQCQEIVRGLMTMVVGASSIVLGGAMGAGAHASKAAITKGAAMKAGGAAMLGAGADTAAKGVDVSRSGTISAAAGLMGVQTPYLIISRPRQAVPEEQNIYTGYPSFITEDLSELEGYTEVQMIHLHEMSCTEDEFNEIDELLVAGVIF